MHQLMDIGSPEWSRLIIAGAALAGLDLGPDQLALFTRHARELLKWNAITNLTAITDAEAIARNHFLDSLAPASLIAPGSEMLDAGAGAGFPGLPLHIVIAGLRTTLLDAARKKVSFLRHVVRELELKRIRAIHTRVEDLARQPAQALRYDVVLARAFGALPELVTAALPLLKPQGRLIALRGADAAAAVEDIRTAAVSGSAFFSERLSFDLRPYTLSGLKKQRTLVIVTRVEAST